MYASLKRRPKSVPNEKRSTLVIQENRAAPRRDSVTFSTKHQELSNNDVSKEKLTRNLKIIQDELEQITSEIHVSNKRVENVKALIDETEKNIGLELNHT